MDFTLLLILFTLFCLIAFLFLNKYNPTSLFTGFAFFSFIFMLLATLFTMLSLYNEKAAIFIILPFAILFVIVALLWIFILIAAVLINTRIILKRERKSIANLLPLIALLGFFVVEIMLFILSFFPDKYNIIKMITTFVNGMMTYFIFVFLLYAFTAIMYKFMPTFRKIDYIIILGAGLINDRVTPLLASRINAGVQFYKKQVKRKKHNPTIILSGGQGADEGITEAQAMKNYIDETYNESFNIYLEDQSTTTLENIRLSEKLAQEKDGISSFKHKKIALATSDYHLLRAGQIARKDGIPAYGVGGKTRFYYIPTAFIREFIGYVVLKKRIHLIMTILIFLGSILSFIIDYYNK